MWCASAKFIKEYEKCVEDWTNKVVSNYSSKKRSLKNQDHYLT